jgi:FtsZ-interacting cell division protein ZipA
MNWITIVIFGIVIIGLVVFTIIRNQKDKKELEQQINEDYPKKNEGNGEIEIEEEE